MVKVLSVIFALFLVLSFVRYANGREYMPFQGFVEMVASMSAKTEADEFLESLNDTTFDYKVGNLEVWRSKIVDPFKWLADMAYTIVNGILSVFSFLTNVGIKILTIAWAVLKLAFVVVQMVTVYLFA